MKGFLFGLLIVATLFVAAPVAEAHPFAGFRFRQERRQDLRELERQRELQKQRLRQRQQHGFGFSAPGFNFNFSR